MICYLMDYVGDLEEKHEGRRDEMQVMMMMSCEEMMEMMIGGDLFSNASSESAEQNVDLLEVLFYTCLVGEEGLCLWWRWVQQLWAERRNKFEEVTVTVTFSSFFCSPIYIILEQR